MGLGLEKIPEFDRTKQYPIPDPPGTEVVAIGLKRDYRFADGTEGGYTSPDGTSVVHRYNFHLIYWGSTDFIYGETKFGAMVTEWVEAEV